MGTIEKDEPNRASDQPGETVEHKLPKKEPWWFNQALAIDRFTGWLMVYTGLLFLATIFNAAVLIKTDLTLHDTLVENKKAADAAVSASRTARDTLIASQRPWVSIEIENIGPLTFGENGAGISFKLNLKNTGNTPAIGVLATPSIFVREKQPFRAYEIISRRIASWSTGGGFGHTLFPGETFSEVIGTGMEKSEYADLGKISTFMLIAVKYKSALSDEIRSTAKLYMLSRADPFRPGAAFVFDPVGSLNPNEMIVTRLGSHAE